MDAFMQFIEEKMLPIANKLGESRFFNVLRDAFMLSFPLTMFGSFVVVLTNLPFLPENIQAMLSSILGNGQNATMGVMVLFVTFGIGYYYTKTHTNEGIYGGAVALSSFLILTPFFIEGESGVVDGILSLDRLGAKAMFIAIISSFLSAYLYNLFTNKGWQIKMPEGVPPAVTKSFASLIPAFLTLLPFLLINSLIVNLWETNLHDVIYQSIQKPMMGMGSSLPATLISIFMIQILWFFGLHGQIIVNSVMDPIWNTLNLENLEVYTQTGEVPNVISKSFMEIYTVGLGGSGMTLAVVVLIAFVLKSRQLNDVGKMAIGPGIFNVNEPIIFGLPIVMNPIIFIPWILAPIIVTIINYIVMNIGIVPAPTGVGVPWTVPIVLNGVLATNSLRGGILQIVDFIVVALIWYPFLKILDEQNLQQENN